MENKEHGYYGLCCCNCKFQIELRKHPMNRKLGNGSITESFGYACINNEINKNNEGIFYENKHGMCENHEKK